MSFADKVKKMVEEAPVASAGGANVNFGPLVITPLIVRWKGRGQKPDKYTIPEYMEKHDLEDEDDIELEEGKESFQLHFDIDVSVLNPSLDFHYERDVAIVESKRDPKHPDKEILTSWSEVVKPGMEKVFGKDWYSKVLPNGKKAAPVLYAAAENVDAVEPVKEGKKNYGVPKLIASYKDLDACRKARDERYPPRDEEAEMAFGPEDEEEDEEEEGEGIPESVIKQVKELYGASRKNFKQTRKYLEENPFGEYDPDELLAAAGIKKA